MSSLIFHIIAWPTLGIALLLFGFAPGAVLRLIVLCYDRDNPRRRELLGELYGVARIERPFWVAEQLEVALFEGLRCRLAARRARRVVADEKQSYDVLLDTAERIGRDHPDYPLLIAQGAAGLMIRGLAELDLTLVNRAIPALAGACSVPSLPIRERTRLLETYGVALLTRYSLTRSPRDLSSSIDRLEEARRTVDQEPGSPHSASVLQRLASAYRMRGDQAHGDVDRAVSLGLAGLRALAVHDVLLQATDKDALSRARQGTSDATDLARWLLQHDRAEEALSALELGRGMVLQAASSGAVMETALRESGHADLADEWVAGPTDNSDLRYRAILAIENSPSKARPLSPPSFGDIATALAEVDADALVYLIPKDDNGGGLAVLVDRAAAIRILPLSELTAGAKSPIAAFLRTRRATDAAAAAGDREAEETARQSWLSALKMLCTWAWRVAVGRLLGEVSTIPGRTEPRIVLVPCGELRLVPWHAARCPDDGQYACQEAIISYASSARQFVDASRCRPRPWAEQPVLISDSPESMQYSAVSVAGLHDAYYRNGAVFGGARMRLNQAVSGSPAVTLDDVMAALPGEGRPGASLLHLSCHSRVETPTVNTSILLGTDNEGHENTIRIRDILRQAHQRPPSAPGGLVVLSACASDVTEADYDESLTLATAFVSAGATGVIGAAWWVPEAETTIFMTLVHHFLNSTHPNPVEALRKAQLWMLNPTEELPCGLPPILQDKLTLTRDAGDRRYASPEFWAAFSYQGR